MRSEGFYFHRPTQNKCSYQCPEGIRPVSGPRPCAARSELQDALVTVATVIAPSANVSVNCLCQSGLDGCAEGFAVP
jgi:hypothetical protein